MTISVAVSGASGYAGGEVLRILAAHPEQGWLTDYEPEQKGMGAIGVAAVLPEAGILQSDGQNAYLLATISAGKPFVWYAGACWSGAGDFVTPAYWNGYVSTFAAALRARLGLMGRKLARSCYSREAYRDAVHTLYASLEPPASA